MRILFIHAHFDDYEFTAAGTFELWKRKLGDRLRAKVIICTDGKAGHHTKSRDETGRIRLREQQASARIGGYEFEQLRYPNGRVPREACLQVSTDLLAALWKVVRDFEPDYLFCPPLPFDPLAGIHVDHIVVAEAIRKVAYMINVPHAFTPEFPAGKTKSRPCKVPVVLTVHDAYMSGTNVFDLAVEVEEAFDKICAMSWCHRSQITEWLPWVGRHDLTPPKSRDEWGKLFRQRLLRRNRELGIKLKQAVETFSVTAWGGVPDYKRLLIDFPEIHAGASNLNRLKKQLAVWQNH